MSKLEKGSSYPGLEIIVMLAAVPEVEPSRAIEGAGGQKGRRGNHAPSLQL
jgi:hypothetical protein